MAGDTSVVFDSISTSRLQFSFHKIVQLGFDLLFQFIRIIHQSIEVELRLVVQDGLICLGEPLFLPKITNQSHFSRLDVFCHWQSLGSKSKAFAVNHPVVSLLLADFSQNSCTKSDSNPTCEMHEIPTGDETQELRQSIQLI